MSFDTTAYIDIKEKDGFDTSAYIDNNQGLKQSITAGGVEGYVNRKKQQLKDLFQGIRNIPQNIMNSQVVKNPGAEIPAMMGQFAAAPIVDTAQMAYNVPASFINTMIDPFSAQSKETIKPLNIMPPQTTTQAGARLLGDLFAPALAKKTGALLKTPIAKTLPFLSDLPEEVYKKVLEKPYLMEKNAPAIIGAKVDRYKQLLHKKNDIGQTAFDNKPIIDDLYTTLDRNNYGGQSPLTLDDFKELVDIRKKAENIKTLEQAQGLKIDLSNNYISWGKKSDVMNQELQRIETNLNNRIGEVFPKLAEANNDYSFLRKNEKDLKYLNSAKGVLPKRQIARTGWALGMGAGLSGTGAGIPIAAALEAAQSPLVHAQGIKYIPKLTNFFQVAASMARKKERPINSWIKNTSQ